MIEDLEQEKNDLNKALDIITKYDCLKEAKSFAEAYTEKAKDILNKLPQNNFNMTLNTICEFVFKRKN